VCSYPCRTRRLASTMASCSCSRLAVQRGSTARSWQMGSCSTAAVGCDQLQQHQQAMRQLARQVHHPSCVCVATGFPMCGDRFAAISKRLLAVRSS
jgi:hypothetical protein